MCLLSHKTLTDLRCTQLAVNRSSFLAIMKDCVFTSKCVLLVLLLQPRLTDQEEHDGELRTPRAGTNWSGSSLPVYVSLRPTRCPLAIEEHSVNQGRRQSFDTAAELRTLGTRSFPRGQHPCLTATMFRGIAAGVESNLHPCCSLAMCRGSATTR